MPTHRSSLSVVVAVGVAAALLAPAAAGAALLGQPQVLAPVAADDDLAAVAGPAGRVAVTWSRAAGTTTFVAGAERLGVATPFSAPQARTGVAQLGDGTHVSAYAPDGTLQSVWIGLRGRVPAIETGDPAAPTVLDRPVGPIRVAFAIGADGTAAAAWRTVPTSLLRGGSVRVAVRPAGGAWSAPVDVQTSDVLGQLAGPAVTVAGDGAVTVAWAQDDGPGGQALAVRHRPPGGTFGPVASVPLRGYGAVTTLLLVGRRDGTQTLVASKGGPATLEAFDGAAGRFGPPTLVGATGEFGGSVQLTGNERGDVALAFTGGRTATRYARTQVAYRPAGGAWTAPAAFGGCGGRRRGLAVDDAGQVVVAYEQRPGANVPASSGAPGPGSVLTTVRRPDGVWRAPEELAAGQDAAAPALAVDSTGGIVLAARVDGRVQAYSGTIPPADAPEPGGGRRHRPVLRDPAACTDRDPGRRRRRRAGGPRDLHARCTPPAGDRGGPLPGRDPALHRVRRAGRAGRAPEPRNPRPRLGTGPAPDHPARTTTQDSAARSDVHDPRRDHRPRRALRRRPARGACREVATVE